MSCKYELRNEKQNKTNRQQNPRESFRDVQEEDGRKWKGHEKKQDH